MSDTLTLKEVGPAGPVKTANMRESSRLWSLMFTELWINIVLSMLLSFEASSNGIKYWSEYTPFEQAKVVMTSVAAGMLVMKAFYSTAVSEYRKSKEKDLKAQEDKE